MCCRSTDGTRRRDSLESALPAMPHEWRPHLSADYLATRPKRFPVVLRRHRSGPDGFRAIAPTRASIPESGISISKSHPRGQPQRSHSKANTTYLRIYINAAATGGESERRSKPLYHHLDRRRRFRDHPSLRSAVNVDVSQGTVPVASTSPPFLLHHF